MPVQTFCKRTDDARRSTQPLETYAGVGNGDPIVWMMLALNLLCDVIIAICFMVITWKARNSTDRSEECDDLEREQVRAETPAKESRNDCHGGLL